MRDKPYAVHVSNTREKFEKWIAERGGVAVWENANMSNPGAGNMFTPATTDGKPTPSPHWTHPTLLEVCKSIRDFRFVKEMKEVRRLRVAVRRGAQGLSLKLTDSSTKKLHMALDKVKEETGQDAFYHFDYDTQEAVIEVPVWE